MRIVFVRMFRASEYSHTAKIALVLYMQSKCGDHCSGIVQCSWEAFRHMLSNELSISGSNFLREQTRVSTSKAEFVDFGLNFGDLFRTLLC